MTEEELEAIGSRLAKITPGKWTATAFDVHTDTPTGVWNTTQICPVTPAMGKNDECYQRINAEFIANAPGDERALIAEVRRLRAEAAKNELLWLEKLNALQRVFAWEPFEDEGSTHYRLCFGDDFAFQLGNYHESCCLALYCDEDYVGEWDVYRKDNAFDEAEQMIRELGFARDGDIFDRSKVEK